MGNILNIDKGLIWSFKSLYVSSIQFNHCIFIKIIYKHYKSIPHAPINTNNRSMRCREPHNVSKLKELLSHPKWKMSNTSYVCAALHNFKCLNTPLGIWELYHTHLHTRACRDIVTPSPAYNITPRTVPYLILSPI